jgi:hypothetical protein
MDRRTFLAGTGAVLLAAPLVGGAQQATRPPAEDQYVEIVPGKTTKQEIVAFFGQPDYGTIQGSEGEELIYYIRSLGPPYPMWFRNPSLRNRNGMLLFLVDQRGLFVSYSVTSQPSP